jgi:hypothetical protein
MSVDEIEQIRGICSKCGQMVFVSYFLFKTDIETADVCYNANTDLCKKCEEPECELAGRHRKEIKK